MDSSLVRFGKYLLLERINIGGMAEVFRAKTFGVEGFERIVAIKRILPSLIEDDEFVTMFIDEARIAVQLNHPNITQIYELGKHGDHYYIAMEFLASRDLRLILDRLNDQQQLMPIPQAAYIATKICEALDYAHRKRDAGGTPMNIIHRDVSPQNILVSFDGDVKMIDFGIAKAANRASKTQVGVLKGKFAYMSPEQVRGLPIDRRSDVFAVGIVLYEMLTGERLFIAESDFSTLQKVRDAVVEPPSTFNRKILPELEAIVMKALARDVEDRYQWTSDLAEALQPYLIEGRTIYGSKNLETFIRDAYAPEVASEREKMEQFREVRASGLEFGEVSQETEPQNYSESATKNTQEGPAEDEASSEESETIILEASNMEIAFGNKEDTGQELAVSSLAQQDSSKTAESEDDFDDDSSDVTIVQMATPFFNQKTSDDMVEPLASPSNEPDENPQQSIIEQAFRPGLTNPSDESELPTIAIPAAEIQKASDDFAKIKQEGELVDPLAENAGPSITLPASLPDEDDIMQSNDATIASPRVDPNVFEAPKVSTTDETKAIDAAAILPLLQEGSQTENQSSRDKPSQTAALPDDNTISHQISAEDSLLGDQSSLHQGSSFSDFYGSPKSDNPFVAIIASWIRNIPKSFRMPVFMMIGAIGALFLILMIVGSMRVLNTPVGQIELQKMPGEKLPEGLKVLLDGKVVGTKLPLKIPSVTVGPHQISATAGPQCEAPDFDVKVLEGQAIFLPLSIKCGAEQLNTVPDVDQFKKWRLEIRVVNESQETISEAIVFIDEEKQQATPFVKEVSRSKDSVKIRIEAVGYETKKLTASHNGVQKPPPIIVTLKKFPKPSVAKVTDPVKTSSSPKVSKRPASHLSSGFKKTIKTASLEIATSPSAKVYVDGKNTGLTTPIYNTRALQLTIGVHIIEFRVKGKRKGYKYRVHVKADDSKNKLVIQKLGKNKVRVYGKISARLTN